MSIVMNMSSYEIERDKDDAYAEEVMYEEWSSYMPKLSEHVVTTERPRLEPPGGWGNVDIGAFLKKMYVFQR